MQRMIDVVEMAHEDPSLDGLAKVNQSSQKMGLVGRPLVIDPIDALLTFNYNPEDQTFTQVEETEPAIAIGRFVGMRNAGVTILDEDGVYEADSAMVVIKDPVDKLTHYAAPTDQILGSGVQFSDVLIDLANHPIAQEIESVLEQEVVDMFALAALYRKINGEDLFEMAQFSSHAQHLFKKKDLFKSITAETAYLGYYNGVNLNLIDMPYYSTGDEVPFALSDIRGPFLAFISLIIGDDGVPVGDKRTYLNQHFVGYERPD